MSDTKVKLDATCDRTGKTETLEITLDDAASFQAVRDLKTKNAEQLMGDLGKIARDKMPDLIVAYKGTIVILANVNPKSDDAMSRLLHDVTRDETSFPKPSVKKRKAKETEVQGSTSSSIAAGEVPVHAKA